MLTSKIFVSNKIYISDSSIPKIGRGVFALVNIKKGEIIEICPTITFPENQTDSLSQTELMNYIFFAGKNKNVLVLALGFGSLYNHSNIPNAKYKIDLKNELITFRAIKDIKKDEEIFINYKGDKTDMPLWFENPYFVYILRTDKDTLYVGQTNNLKKRIKEHKERSRKSAKYMRYFSSFELVHSEVHKTRSDAMKREAEIKKWPKAKKEELVKQTKI